MLRILLLALVLGGGAVCIEPALDRSERTLVLRLRAPGEIVGLAARVGGELLARASAALERDEVPAVASGPRGPDGITDADREELDRLLEEKLRE